MRLGPLARRRKPPMVARKWTRLAEAVIAELGSPAEGGSLSKAPDDVLLQASERCGLLLAPQFRRTEDRLFAIRRRLDEVSDAKDAPAALVDESDEAEVLRRLQLPFGTRRA